MSEFVIALHALVFLAHTNGSFSSEELSENLCTNSVRIRKVMSKCKRAGLITTKAGVNGGYSISRPGSEINIKQIYDAVGIPILESKWHSGSVDSECLIASSMAEYIDYLFGYLNNEMACLLECITLDKVEEKLEEIRNNKLNLGK